MYGREKNHKKGDHNTTSAWKENKSDGLAELYLPVGEKVGTLLGSNDGRSVGDSVGDSEGTGVGLQIGHGGWERMCVCVCV